MRAPDLALYKEIRPIRVLPAGLLPAGKIARSKIYLSDGGAQAPTGKTGSPFAFDPLLSRPAARMQYPQCRGYGLLQAG